MFRFIFCSLCLAVSPIAHAQQPSADPFTIPIEANAGIITVDFVEFARIPDTNGEAPRLMHLVDEPRSQRLFVSAMTGALYSVSRDGKTVTPFIDINAAKWGVGVQSKGSEQGLQSFAFHPEFGQRGAPGYGKFYTYTDTTNITPQPDFVSGGSERTHDTVLLEWTAKNAEAANYDGGAPKELFRVAQPFRNHNGGQVGFNTLATRGSPDYGLLYVGLADGGSGGDPLNTAQNLNKAFGKILRIDPLGTNSASGKYGIPAFNPFVGKPDTLGEIFAYGVRNPQRFTWDSKNGTMYVAEIGQNQVEEISPVTSGANLGWNKWEGSYRYLSREGVDLENPRSEPGLTWPVIEYDHKDPLFTRVAITGISIYRQNAIRQLQNRLIFGDNPSGELFHVNADNLPQGGQSAIRRILLNDKGQQKTLLQLIREKKPHATRADLRFGTDIQGRLFILNKQDGVIRLLVAAKNTASN
ncbi:MAG: hypothetical protein HOP04_03715 [Methylophilaceae bacterium]|nr:hypothetical protein [Methylophilaceae bacterium]